MRIRDLYLVIALVALALLSACSVKVDKNNEGKEEKVDIKSPFGNIKVNKNVTAADTGLPVYAGAQLMPDSEEGKDDSRANVNIDSPFGGVKVIVAKYSTNDPEDKVLDFYRKEMKKNFGTVVECRGETDNNVNPHDDDRDDPVTCTHQDSSSKVVELKTGTNHKQHIVAIKPRGDGSQIDLVYVKVHGKDDSI
jgi:hypothetical protein